MAASSHIGQARHFNVLQECSCRCLAAGDLQFLQSRGDPLDGPLCEQISYCAARGGHLEVLQWLQQLGHALCHVIRRQAAAGGHLVVLQWTQEQGWPWEVRICAAAARNGHLAILRWARHHGLAWDPSTCEAAARGGHLEVLQIAPARVAVPGARTHVQLQPKKATWQCCSLRARMAVSGIQERAV